MEITLKWKYRNPENKSAGKKPKHHVDRTGKRYKKKNFWHHMPYNPMKRFLKTK